MKLQMFDRKTDLPRGDFEIPDDIAGQLSTEGDDLARRVLEGLPTLDFCARDGHRRQ